MNFTKMHGAGNDYVYVDATRVKIADPAKLSIAVSDRHTGIGSDGLILIAPSKRADFRMVMFNADGSESAMCGNGIRCIGKYVYDHKLTKKRAVTVETGAGIVGLELHLDRDKVDRVTVAMGQARAIPPSFHRSADGVQRVLRTAVEAAGRTLAGTVVSMGNPHFVVEVEDVDGFPVAEVGRAIETHPDFPSRVNVEFIQVIEPGRIKQRTWERGSGETMACGSGACAVAVAMRHAGRTGDETVISLRGGDLTIQLGAGDLVFMTGPAVEVFSGEWPGTRAPAAAARPKTKAKAGPPRKRPARANSGRR